MPTASSPPARRLLFSLALAALLALAGLSPAAEAQENRWLAPSDDDGWLVAAGAFDTAGDHQDIELTVGYTLPYRIFPDRWFELVPEVGITATDEGGGWIWFAFLWRHELGDRWTVTPFTGGTLYERGDGKELGGVVEFRSGLELGYRLGGDRQIGLSFYHLSNADIYDANPGVNSLVVTFRW